MYMHQGIPYSNQKTKGKREGGRTLVGGKGGDKACIRINEDLHAGSFCGHSQVSLKAVDHKG